MNGFFISRVLITASCGALLLSGCIFGKVEQDSERFEQQYRQLLVETRGGSGSGNRIYLVASTDVTAQNVVSVRVQSTPGRFDLRVSRDVRFLFAFEDANGDARFQSGESSGSLYLGDSEAEQWLVEMGANSTTAPNALVGLDLFDVMTIHSGIEIHMGTTTDFENPDFSRELAEKGLWEPVATTQLGILGIYFLEDYDPDKIPVLFVHGISGTPTEFQALSNSLDRATYQPWLFYYPSGLRLGILANGLFSYLEALHSEHEFEQLHIVAHSMGGLVTRGTINQCEQRQGCGYISSYTTISTPWGGHRGAQTGIKYAPAVVPVWNDMAPGSDYLNALFETPLPEGLRHYLLFSFKGKGDDGVVSLDSMLRPEAQNGALFRYGHFEDHAGILQSQRVALQLNRILQRNTSY